jgi:hypothetical protein
MDHDDGTIRMRTIWMRAMKVRVIIEARVAGRSLRGDGYTAAPFVWRFDTSMASLTEGLVCELA